ncbi:MAG: S8 family serine peptidase [Candidatus Fermentibacteraceae bacterium]
MRFLAAVLLLLLPGVSPGNAPVRYWVFFTDRGPMVESRLQAAGNAIAQGPSASRRASVGALSADIFDLEPYQGYTEIVAAEAEARIAGISRYLNACSVVLDQTALQAVRALPFVASVRPVAGSVYSPTLLLREPDPHGLSLGQLLQAGITGLHERGFRGEGIVMGVLDSGFEFDHDCFAGTQILGTWDFVGNDEYVGYEEGDPENTGIHGTAVFSIIAGDSPGLYIGGAPDAAFLLARTEDTGDEYPQEEDFWVFGLEWCEQNGASIVSSSLGYIDWYEPWQMDGNTAVTTLAADIAASRGLIVVNAVGNNGPEDTTLVAPSDGDSVFAVGSVNSLGILSGYSSRGPSADGRIKPDACARGESTVFANLAGGYSSGNGTSFATPIVSAAFAAISQAHPEWSMMRISEALKATASQGGSPDSDYGWGMIDATAAMMHRSVSGRVRRSDTGEALAGYTIQVSNGQSMSEAVTSDLGWFAVEPGFLGEFTVTGAPGQWGLPMTVQGILGQSGTEVSLFVDPAGPSGLAPSVFPNPASDVVHIGFDVEQGPSDVTLAVFSLDGVPVHTQGRNGLPAGTYRAPIPGEAFIWDCRDMSGEPVASGVYMLVLTVGGSAHRLGLAIVR